MSSKSMMEAVETTDLLAVEGGASFGDVNSILSSVRQRITEVRTNIANVSGNALVGDNNSINVVQG
jgi:hypothetical protein